MVNKTILEGLRPYAPGEKLRSLRKSMGLMVLGKHTGLSAAMLSKLDVANCFLHSARYCGSLWCSVWGWSISSLMSASVCGGDRTQEGALAVSDSPNGRSIAYNFESLDFKATERKLKAFYAEFEPIAADKSRPHQHPGVELIYLICGKLDLTIGSETFNLESGDAVYFDSGVRHSYHRVSKTPCTGVIVTA